jgi:DNA mismatch repair ATPase MutL
VIDAKSQIPCFLVTLLTIPPGLIDVNLESDKSQVLIQHHDLILEKIKDEIESIYQQSKEIDDILNASAQSVVPSSVVSLDLVDTAEEVDEMTYRETGDLLEERQKTMNSFVTANIAFPQDG